MKALIAGAPVSFGVFEMTPKGATTLSAHEVLGVLAENGYSGVDLGPSGFFGRGDQLKRELDRFGLSLAGGWVQLPLSDDAAFEAALPELEGVLQDFSIVAELNPRLLPKPTLADAGSAFRQANPGAGARGLDPAAWSRLAKNLETAAARVRAAGLEPTFHHHAGTFVETVSEIDRLLDAVDIGLTLDTGHLLLAGADPVAAVTRWGARINHLHIKDVSVSTLRQVTSRGGQMADVWRSGAFTVLGDGDIDVQSVLSSLDAIGYQGWIVVEQDVLLDSDLEPHTFLERCRQDHAKNRAAILRSALIEEETR